MDPIRGGSDSYYYDQEMKEEPSTGLSGNDQFTISMHMLDDPHINASDLQGHLSSQVNPDEVQRFINHQRRGMRISGDGGTPGPSGSEQPLHFDPGTPYEDPGAPGRFPSEAPSTRAGSEQPLHFDPGTPYEDPGAPGRFPSEAPSRPSSMHPESQPSGGQGPIRRAETPLFQAPGSSLHGAVPQSAVLAYGRQQEPARSAPTAPSRRPSMPPPDSQPSPSRQSGPSRPPASGSGSSRFQPHSVPPSRREQEDARRMPPPPAPGPRPPRAGTLPHLSRIDTNPDHFKTEGLPQGWAVKKDNMRDNMRVKSPGGSIYNFNDTGNKDAGKKNASQKAVSDFMMDMRDEGLVDKNVAEVMGRTGSYFRNKNLILPNELKRPILSPAESGSKGGKKGGPKGGKASQANVTPEQRFEWSSKGGKARQAQLTPEERLAATSHAGKIGASKGAPSKAGKARQAQLTPEERSQFAGLGGTMKAAYQKADKMGIGASDQGEEVHAGPSSAAGPSEPGGSRTSASQSGRAAGLSGSSRSQPIQDVDVPGEMESRILDVYNNSEAPLTDEQVHQQLQDAGHTDITLNHVKKALSLYR